MREKCISITSVQVGHVLGKGGSTLHNIEERTGVNLEILEEGPQVRITAEDDAHLAAAEAEVRRIVSQQENPDYEGPEGRRLRKEATHFGDKRSKLFEEATKRREAGDHEGSKRAVAEGKEAGEKMVALHREAAEAIATYNNEAKGKGENYFDMHGLREEEAMEMLRRRMAKLEARPAGATVDFEIIPGAGHHSAPGAQKLKSATVELLKSKGYPYEELNAGTFLVKVHGTSAVLPTGVKANDTTPTEPTAPQNVATPTKSTKCVSFCACM